MGGVADSCSHTNYKTHTHTHTQHTSETRLLRVGVLTAITLTAHNFPEGMAVALRYKQCVLQCVAGTKNVCSACCRELFRGYGSSAQICYLLFSFHLCQSLVLVSFHACTPHFNLCVAVRCSVLQCVAVCCSALQCALENFPEGMAVAVRYATSRSLSMHAHLSLIYASLF